MYAELSLVRGGLSTLPVDGFRKQSCAVTNAVTSLIILTVDVLPPCSCCQVHVALHVVTCLALCKDKHQLYHVYGCLLYNWVRQVANVIWLNPSRNKTLNRCWFTVGPASYTVDQRGFNVLCLLGYHWIWYCKPIEHYLTSAFNLFNVELLGTLASPPLNSWGGGGEKKSEYFVRFVWRHQQDLSLWAIY